MTISRALTLFLAIAVMVAVSGLPGRAAQKDKDDQNIWTEEEPRGPGRGPERGPGPGLGPEGGPGPGRPRGPEGPERFELTDEEIDRIISSLKKSNPEKAKELLKLHKEDPEKFQMELRKYGREEFGKIIKERIETWRRKRQDEFLEWFGKNYPRQAEDLAKLKETQADAYWKKFDLVREKYWRIFEEDRRNPELAEVLKEDLHLKEKREELVKKINTAKNENEKTKLMAELEEVVRLRYDLIIRQKQIRYEQLLKALEELRNRIKQSRDEIAKLQDEKIKNENVKNHIKDLIEPGTKLRWD